MIFCEKTVEQFGLGVADFGAVIAIFSGRNHLPTRPKSVDVIKGTSYASKVARGIFGKARFPFGMQLPTWIGEYAPWTSHRRMVSNIGTIVGRSIPLPGIIILDSDVSQIAHRTIHEYNMIARGNDRFW